MSFSLLFFLLQKQSFVGKERVKKGRGREKAVVKR